MILRLDIERLRTLDEVRDFMAGSAPVDFRFVERADAYGFVRRVLVRTRYVRLSRSDKGLLRRFLVKVTGFSRAQIGRLISQYRATGRIEDRRRGPKRPFPRRYTKADIGLLAEVDETLGGLCGAVTRRMMQRQYAVFGDARFERLAGLSNSHLYRLRRSTTYRRRRLTVAKTRSTQVRIGERRKPHPAGRPGFLRVDSVHQGDPTPRCNRRMSAPTSLATTLRTLGRGLAVPALPLVPGADLRFASISNQKTAPHRSSRSTPEQPPFRLIFVWDYAPPPGRVARSYAGRESRVKTCRVSNG